MRNITDYRAAFDEFSVARVGSRILPPAASDLYERFMCFVKPAPHAFNAALCQTAQTHISHREDSGAFACESDADNQAFYAIDLTS